MNTTKSQKWRKRYKLPKDSLENELVEPDSDHFKLYFEVTSLLTLTQMCDLRVDCLAYDACNHLQINERLFALFNPLDMFFGNILVQTNTSRARISSIKGYCYSM